MKKDRCVHLCSKIVFISTLVFALLCAGFTGLLLDCHYVYQLSGCGVTNVTCPAWRASLRPQHVVLVDAMVPTLLGTGMLAVASLTALRNAQEDRALTLFMASVPFLAVTVGSTARALHSYDSLEYGSNYMSAYHVLYCGLLYGVVYMMAVCILILALKIRRGGTKQVDLEEPQPLLPLRRINSCEVIRTTDPSYARSPILIPKHQVVSATSSAASTRPGSRVGLMSNQSAMGKLPATSVESVLYCVRESNDEHLERQRSIRAASVISQPPLADEAHSGRNSGGSGGGDGGPSDELPTSAMLRTPNDNNGTSLSRPTTNHSMLKVQKTGRITVPPPGTPSESAW